MLRERTVEVLQVGDHHLVPQPEVLQVAHQVLVDDGEFARQVRFHVQVLVGRLDAGRHADDVGDGGGGRDGDAVRIAHADAPDALAQRLPVEGFGQVDVDSAVGVVSGHAALLASSSSESFGRMPRSHSEPSKLE